MNVVKAINSRMSTRAYLSKIVPRHIITKIIETSLRSPSATNSQPWNIYVICGKVLDDLRRDNVKMFVSGVEANHSDVIFQGVFRQRRIELAKELFKLLEIQREDIEKRKEWMMQGYGYFGAPVVIILTVDNELCESVRSILAIGALAQNICLAAINYGLGTCISEQGCTYSDVLKKHIPINDDETIITSIALGYPDPSHPANRLISQRALFNDVVKWIGFDDEIV